MATVLSDESMTKRGLTKDLWELEEDADSCSRIKKQNVEEEEDEDDDSSDSDGDSDVGSDSEWAQYSYVSEREPEWDVDSFDGREFKINPRIRKMCSSQELYDKYYNSRLKAFESKGFLPDPLSGIYNLHIDKQNGERDLIADLANVCIKKFNDSKIKTLELVNVVRVTVSGQAKWKLYITFMAREYPDGPLVEYQAKVLHFITEPELLPFPILCRPSPKLEI
ncbi:hypothetical protein CARUB_v10001911mg [Capsella rubella]|uniref:Cystatin domain-containing protein n=1 Tax=Capsella rubella TaxID=81985 RepID=R0GXA9_9BRAS|nr:uncharacterized protein LOC17882571 [Capsella rubella]EOA21514.1 hypothetical protein CARUB_v10001911mg [Capsella rubella]